MRRRLLVSYLTITALVLALLVVPLGLTFAGRERDQLAADLERDATVIAGLVEDGLDQSEPVDYAQIADAYEAQTGARVVIVDDQGISVTDTESADVARRDFSTRPEFVAALAGDRSAGTRRSDTLGTDLFYVAVPVTSGGEVHGAVRVSYPTSELDDRIWDNWLRLAGLSLVVLAVVAAVGVVLARSVTRPLSDLQQGTAALAAGDLSQRVPEGVGPPEVRSLGRSFNDMAARLDELLRAQQAFVADASHQLRTPLTALRLRLENVQATVGDAATRADIAAAVEETQRLSRLVGGLLLLARADGAVPPSVTVDLAMIVADRIQAWTPLAEEREVALTSSCPSAALVLAVDGAVEQVLDNLVDNALEASSAGGTIEVEVRVDGSGTTLRVVDHGSGMDDEERARAFDRFWRASDARPGGSGLGLAIVSQLVRQSRGEVALFPAEGGGTEARVWFPAAEAT